MNGQREDKGHRFWPYRPKPRITITAMLSEHWPHLEPQDDSLLLCSKPTTSTSKRRI